MAALQRLAGHCAAFLVTPLAGGALVLLTFAIGRRVRSPNTGFIAAWLVATSPALLFMLMWPMTDVPAAAWTALVILFLLGGSSRAAFAAGLAASAGILTRANLGIVVLAGGVWLVIDAATSRAGTSARRWQRIVFFGLGLLPGVLVTAWLNARWYGSPMASGYNTEQLFSISYVWTNASRYLAWLAETSPLALVGIGALAWPTTRLWPGAEGRRAAWLLALSAAAAVSVYLVYEPHTQWWYLRFLLPAWPALFVAAGVACDAVRARGPAAAAMMAVIVFAAGAAGLAAARARGVFELGEVERRYVTVARLVDVATEPSAVILTWQHAGTVRYYAGRDTLRFDVLDPAWLDRAVAWLAARGRHPYVLVEDWEHPLFVARFGQSSTFGDLSFPPAVAWQSSRILGWVFIYDPLRRDVQTMRPGPEFEQSQPICARPAAQPGRR